MELSILAGLKLAYVGRTVTAYQSQYDKTLYFQNYEEERTEMKKVVIDVISSTEGDETCYHEVYLLVFDDGELMLQ